MQEKPTETVVDRSRPIVLHSSLVCDLLLGAELTHQFVSSEQIKHPAPREKTGIDEGGGGGGEYAEEG